MTTDPPPTRQAQHLQSSRDEALVLGPSGCRAGVNIWVECGGHRREGVGEGGGRGRMFSEYPAIDAIAPLLTVFQTLSLTSLI